MRLDPRPRCSNLARSTASLNKSAGLRRNAAFHGPVPVAAIPRDQGAGLIGRVEGPTDRGAVRIDQVGGRPGQAAVHVQAASPNLDRPASQA